MNLASLLTNADYNIEILWRSKKCFRDSVPKLFDTKIHRTHLATNTQADSTGTQQELQEKPEFVCMIRPSKFVPESRLTHPGQSGLCFLPAIVLLFFVGVWMMVLGCFYCEIMWDTNQLGSVLRKIQRLWMSLLHLPTATSMNGLWDRGPAVFGVFLNWLSWPLSFSCCNAWLGNGGISTSKDI